MGKIWKLLLIIVVILFINSSYAQKNNWTLGFRLGYKADILERTNISQGIKFVPRLRSIDYINIFQVCPAALDLTYNITDRLFITSGISYMDYTSLWSIHPLRDQYFWGMEGNKTAIFEDGVFLYDAIQIPLVLKYAIPLSRYWVKNKLNIYGKFGFKLDILDIINSRMENDEYTHIVDLPDTNFLFNYKCTKTDYDKQTNILLNAGIGIEYRFQNGFGLFLEGEYSIGMRTMGQITIETEIVPANRSYNSYIDKFSDIVLLFKGNYWNVSLGVSYTFKKKKNVSIVRERTI
jgi:hypothetical protein